MMIVCHVMCSGMDPWSMFNWGFKDFMNRDSAMRRDSMVGYWPRVLK